MSDNRIVTDGSEPDSSSSWPRLSGRRRVVVPWFWVLLGLGVGLGLSSLGRGAPRTISPTTVDVVATTLITRTLGLGEVILEFPDNLNVVVSRGGGRALEVVTWPIQGAPAFRSIALSDLNTVGTPRFDSSGQFLAASVQAGDRLLLESGRPTSFDIIANGISGFAWHDANAADLAWSTMDQGILQIWVSDDAGAAEGVFEVEGIQGDLVAFGDWGFAVAEVTGLGIFRTHILTPAGQLLGTLDGLLMASHNNGQLILTDDGVYALIPSVDGVPDLGGIHPIDTEEGGLSVEGLGSAFSPDGTRVALIGFEGVTVVDLTGTDEPVSYSIRARSGSIVWTSDGRFLVVSSFRGVAVIDTRSGEMTLLLDDQTTRAVGLAPIGGP